MTQPSNHGPTRQNVNGSKRVMREKMDWLAWRLKTERVVSELIGVPGAYILLDTELPPGSCDGCWGATWPGMAAMLRDEIGVRWRGDGPAMLVNATAIMSSLAGEFVDDLPATLEAMGWGVVAHEIAHVCEWPSPTGGGLADGLTYADFLVDVPASLRNRVPRPFEHGSTFCWTCLHILHRLKLRGIDTCLVAAIDFTAFNLPRPAYVMRSEIAAELRAMAFLPLKAIARYPPPDLFQDLFIAENFPASILPPPQELKDSDMTSFFERLESTKVATIAAICNDWRALVRAVADGKEPDQTETLTTLSRLGKTPADLRADVQTLHRRRQLSGQIADAEAARLGLATIEDQIRAADRLFNVARGNHEQTVGPLFAQLANLNAASGRVQSARDELERTASPQLRELLRENGEALDRSRRQRWASADRIDETIGKSRELDLRVELVKRQGDDAKPEESESRGAQLTLASLREEASTLDADIATRQQFDDQHRPKLYSPDSI